MKYGSGIQQDFSNCVGYTDSLRGNIGYVQYYLDEDKNRELISNVLEENTVSN